MFSTSKGSSSLDEAARKSLDSVQDDLADLLDQAYDEGYEAGLEDGKNEKQ